MALVSCPECKQSVSTFASVCPHCGFPVGTSTLNEKGQLVQKPLDTEDVPVTAPTIQAHAATTEALPVGSYMAFGNWDNLDIDWLVLANDGEKALVISARGLDCAPFDEMDTNTTWKTCTLRTWLNGPFFHGAFSAEERTRVDVTVVQNPSSAAYGTEGGPETHDRLFLLSLEEANQFFESKEARICKPTPRAKEKGVWTDEQGFCRWWLRSPGHEGTQVAYALSDGGLFAYGSFADIDVYAVRPAMWISLQA